MISTLPDPVIALTTDLIVRSINTAAYKLICRSMKSQNQNANSVNFEKTTNVSSISLPKLNDSIYPTDAQSLVNQSDEQFEFEENTFKIIDKNLAELFHSPIGRESSLSNFFTAVNEFLKNNMASRIDMDVDILLPDSTRVSRDNINPNVRKTLRSSSESLPNETEEEEKDENKPDPFMDQGSVFHFDLIAVNGTGEVVTKSTNSDSVEFLVLTIHDVTDTVALRTTLMEENLRAESYHALILPHPLAKSFQDDEKEIVISGQNPSVILGTIVGFRKWAVEMDPNTVALHYSSIKAEFDKIIGRYESLTRIDSIGYEIMAIGGIFDESNMSAKLIAQQSISFALDMINSLESFNRELKTNFGLRIGIHVGGTLYATVLKSPDSLAFDAVGSSIGMARLMEKEGVINAVHIPRQTYELIYGSLFIVKEGKTLQSKSGDIKTFFVTGYQQQN